MKETIEAEIVDDDFKAPVLQDIEYPVTKKGLEALVVEYADIPDIDLEASDEEVGEQYKFVLEGHKRFVKERNKIEKTRKHIKDPAYTFGKRVDEFAKKLQLIIKGTEDKLKLQRERVEQNEARKQEESEQAEQLRIDEIKSKILDIKNLALVHFNSDSELLTKALEALIAPSEEIFNEFLPEAREVQQIAIMQLQEMRKSKLFAEKGEELEAERVIEAQKLKDEQDAELQKEKDLFEEQKAEFAKEKEALDNLQKAIQEQSDRKEAERLADELQAKQEAEKLEIENESKELYEKRYNETWDDLQDSANSEEALLDLIIDGKIRHIRWEA